MIKKTKIALSAVSTALVAVTGLAVAPLASADDLTVINERITVLEQQGAVNANAAYNAEEVTRLNTRLETLEQQEATRSTRGTGSMVFFRGGYARNNVDRHGDILTDTAGFAGQQNGDKEGWYVGAGLDLNLSDDMFGLDDNTQLVGEIMFEYKQFERQNLDAAALPTVANTVLSGATGDPLATTAGGSSVTVSQFTLTASPKIKFMKNTWFNPWIIPVGLAIHVISPPSDGVTVLLPGMHFGAGIDFKVWRNVYVGIDARYNLTFQDVDGVDINGMTTGAYAGFGF